jgi:hypothetical protein
MSWDHHATIWDLRWEHGFAEWTDDMVAEQYPSLCGPDGMPDWMAIHRRDHAGGAVVHRSDDDEEVTA